VTTLCPVTALCPVTTRCPVTTVSSMAAVFVVPGVVVHGWLLLLHSMPLRSEALIFIPPR